MMKRIIASLVLLALMQNACSHDWYTFRGTYLRRGVTNDASRYDLNNTQLIWNYTTGGAVRSSPSVADLNGDGLFETVVGSDDDMVYAINSSGGLMWQFSTGDNVRSSPTIADVDDDGKMEVAVGSDDRNLYVLDRKGKLLWKYATGGEVRSSPAVEDLGGTPDKEIVFGSYDGKIYCLNSKGEVEWEYPTADGVGSSAALFDVDGDNHDEVIIGSNDNMVYVIKHPPYKVWSYSTYGDITSTPAIDATGAIVVGSEDGRVHRLLIQSLGTVQTRRVRVATGWTTESISMTGLYSVANYTASGSIVSSAAIGNINSTDSTGIIVGSNDHTLYFLLQNTTLGKRYTISKPIESSPAIADLNGDNITDIIFGGNDGMVYVVRYPGVSEYSYSTGGPVRSSPAVADLTGDGTLEFIVGSDDKTVYAFGDSYAAKVMLADAIYGLALKAKGIGDVDEAVRRLFEANGTYWQVNNTAGILRCENLLKTIEADADFNLAQAQYLGGNLSEAGSQLDKAIKAYMHVNDETALDKAEILYKKIEAERYYVEAGYYYSIGLILNATIYADAARMFYRSVNDAKGIEKTEKMVNVFKYGGKADTYYNDGMVAREDGKLDDAIMFLGFARQSYKVAGNTEAADNAERLINDIRADKFYLRAVQFSNVSDWEGASEYAQKAIELYENGSSESIAAAIILYNKSQKLIEGKRLYDEAQGKYTSTKFEDSLEAAREAMELFNSSGDLESYLRAEKLYRKAKDAAESESGGSGGITHYLLLITLIAAGAVAIMLIKRPSEPMYPPWYPPPGQQPPPMQPPNAPQ